MNKLNTFIRFATVGASGTVVNVVIFNLLILQAYFHRHYLLANLVAVVVATSFNFYWHNRWTFENQAEHKSWKEKYWQFCVVTSLVLALNSLIMLISVRHFALDRRLANLVAIALCMVFNYTGNALFTFRRANTKQQQPITQG